MKKINIKYMSIITFLAINTNMFAQENSVLLDNIDVISNKLDVTEGKDSYTTESMNTSTKLNLSIKDTPQTVNVITTKEMKDKNITSYKDVVSNISGVSLNNRGTNVVSSARGFYNMYYKIDGFPLYSDYSHNNFDMSIYDRVEIVKGANGLMTGEGKPSLSMNFVRKHANSKDFEGSITLDAGSWDSYSQTTDISMPLSDDKKTRARIVVKNAKAEDFYDNFEKQNHIFYGVIDTDLSDSSSLSLGASYQKLNRDGARNWGLPAFYSDKTRTDFSRSTSIAPNWTYWNLETKEVFGSYKHTFNNDIKFDISTAYRILRDNSHLVKLWWGGALNKDGSNQQIQQFQGNDKDHELNLDSNISLPFTLNNLSHEIIAGISYNKQKSKRTYRSANETPTNLFTYNNSSLLSTVAYKSSYPDKTEQIGSYLVGRFSLNERLNLITGLRVSTWKNHNDDPNKEDREFKNELTPYAGIVFELNENHNIFLSYTDIFKTQNAKDINENYLDPIVGENYEAGIKGEYFDGKLNTNFSVFKIIQDNVANRTNNTLPDGSFAYEALKGVESKGFEISLDGKLTENLDAILALANFEAKEQSGEKVNPEQSRTTANLFLNYKVDKNLNIGAGLKYYSKFHDGTGDEYIEQKAYILANLMAKYKINNKTSLQLNIDNLFDKKYYEGIGTKWMVYGEPRSFNLSLMYKF